MPLPDLAGPGWRCDYCGEIQWAGERPTRPQRCPRCGHCAFTMNRLTMGVIPDRFLTVVRYKYRQLDGVRPPGMRSSHAAAEHGHARSMRFARSLRRDWVGHPASSTSPILT
jgi:hypothetical protein